MTDPVPPPHEYFNTGAPQPDVASRPVRPTLGGHMKLDTVKAADAPKRSVSDEASSAGLPSSQPPGLPLQDSGNSDTSPKAERLPSFRHISKIADAASEEAGRTNAYPPPPPPPPPPVYPPPPVASQSPVLPQQPYPPNLQINPAAFAYAQQISPATAFGDFYYPNPTSPTSNFSNALYHARRQSHPHLYSTVIPQPPALVSMSTNSSSGESYGHHSSMSEAVSSAHTTPLEVSSLPPEHSGRPPPPILPAPQQQAQGQPHVSSSIMWPCDHPGCTAAPFPTQYLLNSHAMSHSSARPHYCPVAGCPRAAGGKGFKRKNELIRHGLTHDTPGYLCPFCPEDKCHRYPRPDNLQRHVRVRHLDKERDDPVLKEVLAQRPSNASSAASGGFGGGGGGGGGRSPEGRSGGDGGRSKGRRRRTGP